MSDELEKKYSKLEWLFYIVILPALFTAVLAGVFMSFLGYNIAGTIRDAVSTIPVINNYLPDEQEEETSINILDKLQEDINMLEEEIDKKVLEIEELTISLEERNSYIEKIELEIKELKLQLENKLRDQQAWENNIADLAQIYTSMPANKAAPIISNLSDIEAIHILNGMSSNDRAKILEKMSPAKAATLTSLLSARPESESEEMAILLAKIEQLNNQLEDKNKREVRIKELAKLYSNLEVAKAAEILAQMSDNEAADILIQMTENKRMLMLDSMPTDRAAQITQLLAR